MSSRKQECEGLRSVDIDVVVIYELYTLMSDVTSGVLKGKGLLSDQPRRVPKHSPLQRRMIFIHFEKLILSFGSLYWWMYIELLGEPNGHSSLALSRMLLSIFTDCLLELH